ncbi:ATP-dependent helicase HrpB [Alteromonas ponticola]|uniref:ATP-dependent helicase HrpB n=1 Tax=Alteromonas aquimaris TaxID=2998417 RepID=A0ABT3PAJ3_9ALTE|nr:ATP-dependent helicase HrpB [Alteromonas aquimaris]MCW8109787.1 ATP-dependent helicase HrpB [Alteromonas aquimaris]
MDNLQALPAYAIAASLSEAVETHNAIVSAPPGAGKSTVLPLVLLNQHFPGRILLMQPRRVVVRSLANYLASLLNEPVGKTVGYRIRGESKISADTRLEIITEGILARRIQSDPELSGVSVIIFDEFHERSIHSDFGLALALEVQQSLRDDLRLIVMSATLDEQRLQTLMPDAVSLRSEGKMYPVEVHYCGQTKPENLVPVMVATIEQACDEVTGDVLAFLPGAGAIRKVRQQLENKQICKGVAIHELYGALGKSAQMAALAPDPTGKQKIILATNIAETSLTIANIEAVVDSGLENVASYQLDGGFTQLNQYMISQASATQRMGRAGRLRKGKCYRLWAREQHDRLSKQATPQILLEDIAPLLLESLAWGSQLNEMALLDVPSAAQQAAATDVLDRIGAIDSQQITSYGRRLATFPCHPSIAHMLVCARDLGEQEAAAAAIIAALYEESALFRDQILVSEIIRYLDPASRRRVEKQAGRYQRLLSDRPLPAPHTLPEEKYAIAIALAFPHHLAFKSSQNTFKLANGRGALIPSGIIENSDWLAVLNAQSLGGELIIRQYQPISQTQINQLYPDAITIEEQVCYNSDKKHMQARQIRRFGEIILDSQPLSDIPRSQFSRAWLLHLQTLPPQQWPFDEATWQWWYRVKLAQKLVLRQPQAFDTPTPWPVLDNPFIDFPESFWLDKLAPCKKWEQVEKLPWKSLLKQVLDWPQQHALDTYLPETLSIPSKRDIPIKYSDTGSACVAVKMQEMYGETQRIVVADGKLPVTFSLLSPAGRPLQTTQDLGAFWQGSYRDIQKEMKGRYPKHFWPDDPSLALPTTRTKRFMK